MDSVATWSMDGKGCGYDRTCSKKYPLRGVCPEGWHLPSKDEWHILFDAVGDSSTAGKMLKSSSGWSGWDGTDAFGFSALPAGFWNDDGSYQDDDRSALFWSSTESGEKSAYGLYLKRAHYANLSNIEKRDGLSVRCLKD